MDQREVIEYFESLVKADVIDEFKYDSTTNTCLVKPKTCIKYIKLSVGVHDASDLGRKKSSTSEDKVEVDCRSDSNQRDR